MLQYKLYKLKNGTETAVWAHDEIVKQESRIAELQEEVQQLTNQLIAMHKGDDV